MTIANEHNANISKLIEKYGKIQDKFGKILGKSKKSRDPETKMNVENDLYQLISESSNCSEFLEFCRSSEEMIKNLEILKEDINLKNYLSGSVNFFKAEHEKNLAGEKDKEDSANIYNNEQVSEEESSYRKKKRENKDLDLNSILENTISHNIFVEEKKQKLLGNKQSREEGDNQEDSYNTSRKLAVEMKKKKSKKTFPAKKPKDTIKPTTQINNTENEAQIDYENLNFNSEMFKEMEEVRDIATEEIVNIAKEGSKITLTPEEGFTTGKKGYYYAFYNKNLRITKYSNLGLSDDKDLSEESSEFEGLNIELDKYDNLNDINLQYTINFNTIRKNLMANNTQNCINPINSNIDDFISKNLEKCLHVRTLYFAEYTLNGDIDSSINASVNFNFEYLYQHNSILPADYQNIKLVLVRKGKQKIHNIEKTCENFFSHYLKRKDKHGNAVYKGILETPFERIQALFSQKVKLFEHLEAIQIEVYLYKWELFNDYNPDVDRTNIGREEIGKLKSLGESLEKLRIADKKKKLILA